MPKHCKHTKRRYTGRTRVDLDVFGRIMSETAKLIYECCKCGKEILQ